MKRKQVKITARHANAVRNEAARRKAREAAMQRAMGVVGAFASGREDISREHDREFAEAVSSRFAR